MWQGKWSMMRRAMKAWLLSPTRGNSGSHTRMPAAPQYSLHGDTGVNRVRGHNLELKLVLSAKFRNNSKIFGEHTLTALNIY